MANASSTVTKLHTANGSITSKANSIIQQRILDAFERQARTVGPRGVVITELVAELGISTKTLYRHFSNKEAIVCQLMHSWTERWFKLQQKGLVEGLPPKQRIEVFAVNWLEHTRLFSSQFWQQLERDFPNAYAIYQQQHQLFLERARHNLTPDIRQDLHPDLALSSLMSLMNHAGDGQLCDSLNLTRKDALLQVINLWAQGALRSELLEEKN
jgi:AcrR family transcriptional regulator